MKYLPLLIIIFLISGSIFSLEQEKTKVLNKNAIKINSIGLAPSATIQEGASFIVKMSVSNEGQNEVVMLVDSDSSSSQALTFDGNYILIDHCEALYTIEDFKILPFHSCSGTQGCQITINPKEQVLFEWTVKAPSKEKMMVDEHRCNFKFNVNYLADTYTIDYIYFATPYFILQKILGNQKVSVSKSNVATYGPVSVNTFASTKDIFLANNEPWDLNVQVQNNDVGIVQIRALDIYLPSQKIYTENGCDGDLFLQENQKISLRADTTKARQASQIFDKSSNVLTCELSSPPNILFLQPYKFVTRLSYQYIIQKEKQATVKTAV